MGIVTNLSQLDEQDTFFLFVNEAISRPNLKVFVFEACDLDKNDFLEAKQITERVSFKSRAKLQDKKAIMSLTDFDMIFLKKDPPITKNYERLLNRLIAKKVPTVNKPQGLFKMGTKTYLKNFPKLTPRTYYANTVSDALKFIKKIGNCMIKKSDSSGGYGVKHVYSKAGLFYEFKHRKKTLMSKENLSEIIDKYIKNSVDKTILVVEYLLSAPKRGDKRVVILEGEILGSYIRLPDKEEGVCVCGNNGAALCPPSKDDIKMVKTLKPHLIKNGIELAALDLLMCKDGLDHLSEINVFNPGFCNLDVVHNKLNIGKRIVDMLCRKMTKSLN